MAWTNDDLANAAALVGSSGAITPVAYDSTVDPATSESGESVYGAGETLWWKWTATFSGQFSFATAGSPSVPVDPNGLDTKMQVFSGPSSGPTHAGLTFVGRNDDQGGSSFAYNSRVTFTATAGTTYYIQVDQFSSGQAGTLHLSWAPTAPTLTSLSASIAKVGDSVIIHGTLLDTVSDVFFGAVAATAFAIDSSTQITATVPPDATPFGSVTVSNGATSNALAFTPLFPGPWLTPAPIYGPERAPGGIWVRSNRSWSTGSAGTFLTGPDASTDGTTGTGTAQHFAAPGGSPAFMAQGSAIVDVQPIWDSPTELAAAMPALEFPVESDPPGSHGYEYQDPAATTGTFDGAYGFHVWGNIGSNPSSVALELRRIPAGSYTVRADGDPGIATDWYLPSELAALALFASFTDTVAGTREEVTVNVTPADLDSSRRLAFVVAFADYTSGSAVTDGNVGVFEVPISFRYVPEPYRWLYDTPQQLGGWVVGSIAMA